MNSFKTLLSNFQDVKIIEPSIPYKAYIAIDLSENNPDLSKELLANATIFENYIEDYLKKSKAKVAYGGYNELRNLYKRSVIFNADDSHERNIHIGIDFWIKEGTTVVAALDGTIHSFANNLGQGNYGPTIILKHEIDNQIFYTLYGHLSLESIDNIQVGAEFKKGQKIGNLGNASVNGGYSPHLHFQIIKNMDGNFGDYPGVCSNANLGYYLENCPDPNLLLKIK